MLIPTVYDSQVRTYTPTRPVCGNRSLDDITQRTPIPHASNRHLHRIFFRKQTITLINFGMSLARRADGALTVPITGEATIVPSENGSPLSTAFAQISDTSNTHTSSVRQSSSEPNSSSSSGSGSLSASNPKSDLNRAVIAVSVIMAVASIVVLIWYLRERRHDRNNMRERERRIRLVQSPRSVLPLQTSFHPSLKSSFGLTGASPDSQWSRTQVSPGFIYLMKGGRDADTFVKGTITPLTRVAVQENLFSPMSQDNLIPSPQRHSPQNSGALPMPPVTANTSRTFRTSIRSIMVNRDVSR